MNRNFAALLVALRFLPLLATAQTLDLRDTVKSFATLTNTTVTITGRAELRVTVKGKGAVLTIDNRVLTHLGFVRKIDGVSCIRTLAGRQSG